ncbi:hypothetical protein BV898_01572 [Hypsibius exemplaris]|uniref:ER membrane protein complex subunit 10 n=1 Tax=Hypsibius exemplaris TaxID=2072580 RepID=A0A1W0XAS6_HYPEX|nr:hypothetical protein BV898_01572 [Hypsibius exemplaris]
MEPLAYLKTFLFHAVISQIFFAASKVGAQRQEERTLTIQHCFENEPKLRCKKVTDLQLTSLRINQTQIFSYLLTNAEKEQIQSAADKGELYFVRARLEGEQEDVYMQSFCKATDVVKSLFVLGITLHVDLFVRPYAVEIGPVAQGDPRLELLLEEPSDKPLLLMGLISVHGSQTGPSPDLEGYRKKLAKERAEKMAAETGDNRSFLAKYWMYIVPVVLFMLFSGQMGGGGAAA